MGPGKIEFGFIPLLNIIGGDFLFLNNECLTYTHIIFLFDAVYIFN